LLKNGEIMKKVLFVLTFFTVFFILLICTASATIPLFVNNNENSKNINGSEIKIEYIYSDGVWYQITYYEDGSIGVIQVARPPDD
jgi:hypothetical protein